MTTLIRINNKSELEKDQEYLFLTTSQSVLDEYGGNIDNVPENIKCKFKAKYLYTDNTIISRYETDRDLFIFTITETSPTRCSNPEFIDIIDVGYPLMFGSKLFTSTRTRIYRSPSRDIYRSKESILKVLVPKKNINEPLLREISSYAKNGGKYKNSRKNKKKNIKKAHTKRHSKK